MKKLLIFTILIALELNINSYAAAWGDADGNGILTAGDAAAVLQRVLDKAFVLPVSETVADVNLDSRLTSDDSALILQKVLDSSFTMPCECENEAMKISIKANETEIIYTLNDSPAAESLYAQLPLTLDCKAFGSSEMTFYPPKALDVKDTPLGSAKAGTLGYYEPWGDVVMYYKNGNTDSSLYELGSIESGQDKINSIKGTITITKVQ